MADASDNAPDLEYWRVEEKNSPIQDWTNIGDHATEAKAIAQAEWCAKEYSGLGRRLQWRVVRITYVVVRDWKIS